MREKNPSAAHSVNYPAQQPLTSRNTCSSIQERSLSDVNSVTIVVLETNQFVGETMQFVGEIKQICWGNEANGWGNEAKCVGEMPRM